MPSRRRRASTVNYKKYRLEHDLAIQTGLLGYEWADERVIVHASGTIIVRAGFSWNGCSPKFSLLDFEFGTNDGAVDQKTMLPKTYKASMLHDALVRSRAAMGIEMKTCDLVFYAQLKRDGFRWAKLYFWAVRAHAIIMRRK